MGLPDINLFGVYLAPIVGPIGLAWLIYSALRRISARSVLMRLVWHPALFGLAIFGIVLSFLVIVIVR